jgi:hypothetical protein
MFAYVLLFRCHSLPHEKKRKEKRKGSLSFAGKNQRMKLDQYLMSDMNMLIYNIRTKRKKEVKKNFNANV